jgi:hypothetical protein
MSKQYRYIGDAEVWVPSINRVIQPDEVVELPAGSEVSDELWTAVKASKTSKCGE